MRVGSLFSGIGGFDLGLERSGMRVVWQSEVDPYASAVLRKHWPHVPNHGDVRSIRGDTVELVDVLCGGFPCQDISVAGKGAGIDGERSGLWREYARLIRELRPRWVVAENVPALRTRGYDRVHDDLEAEGYAVWAFVVGADDVGAPHRRKRVWIVAHAAIEPRRIPGQPRVDESVVAANADTQRLEQQRRGGLLDGERPAQWHDADGRDCPWTWTPRDDPDAERERLEREQQTGAKTWPINRSGDERDPAWLSPVAPVVELDDGIPAGLVRHRRPALACYGNALVPQIAEAIGRVIMRIDQCH